MEILFPATAQRDRIEKKKIYETNGVNEYWLVDTLRREMSRISISPQGKYDSGRRLPIEPNAAISGVTRVSVSYRFFVV